MNEKENKGNKKRLNVNHTNKINSNKKWWSSILFSLQFVAIFNQYEI